jgi:hypothetical protein
VALLFCGVFAVGALTTGIRGDGYRVIGLFALLFTLCFNVAFGRRSLWLQVIRVMHEWHRTEAGATKGADTMREP